MKIFNSTQIRELDQYTMQHEPIKCIDLMERAAKAITQAITERYSREVEFVVFAGPGNNGGDALAVARMLAVQDYSVEVYLFNIRENLSDECAINKQRVIDTPKIKKFTEITLNFDPPQLEKKHVVIDGLFGTGLNKPLAGGFASLVKYINHSDVEIVSIDIPSGLMCEDNTYNIRANIIKANLTLTLQQKKLSMLFADNQANLGEVQVLDIQLSDDYIHKTDTQSRILEEQDARALIKQRGDFVNKGDMGTALIVAGSYGMSGAAILATKACMRAGAGKTIIHTPRKNYDIMQISCPEAIVQLDYEEEHFTEHVATEDYDAVAIGPGLSQNENVAIAMISQLRRAGSCPVVIDADAINILGSHRAWMQQIPQNSILTPHPKEFDRLIGKQSNGSYDRFSMAQNLATERHLYIILKGHYSALFLPDGHVIFNPTGNSGMATAGSGDVLTGIITGLLARGYKHGEACILGMYLHGLAGDLAAKDLGKESLIASDLIQYLPKAFKHLED